MKRLDTDRTVSDLALEDPRLREALESLGIDTCCGGGKPLGEAVREAGLDMDTVRARLTEAAAEAEAEPVDTQKRDWRQASLAELADYIEQTHHAFPREVLPRISERFGKVIQAHGENHGDLLRDVQSTFDGLREEIEAHLLKEEQILFPYLREMSAALDRPARVGGVRRRDVRRFS